MPLASTANGAAGAGGERMGDAGPHPDINDLMQRQTQPRGLTAATGTRKGTTDKINMDAYEAYHNSKDNALLLSQTRSEELGNKDQPGEPQKKAAEEGAAATSKKPIEKKKSDAAGEETKKAGEDKDAKSPNTVTTNNYTTVMQDGANINITNINNHHTYVIYR